MCWEKANVYSWDTLDSAVDTLHVELHFVLFNLENSKNLNRVIIQIHELTFSIYNSLGKLGHTLKPNIIEIDISSWKQDYKEYRGIEIETDTEREVLFFLVETLSLF